MPLTKLTPRTMGRVAACFYLLNIVAGASALFLDGSVAAAALLLATVAYLGVTALFYDLFRPAGPRVSALAAGFSLVGCVISLLAALGLPGPGVSPLGFFGLYCLAIGYLILRSGFAPPLLGVWMGFAGLSWLTFFSTTLTHRLAPYSMAPGILAEVTLTLWLLFAGIDDRQWLGRAATAP